MLSLILPAVSIFDPSAVLGWGALVMAFALGYFVWRTAQAKVWRETAEAYKARNEELQAELTRFRDKLIEQETQISELQTRCDSLAGLPDLTKVLELTRQMLERHDKTTTELVGKLTTEVAKLTEAIERVELRWG